MTRAGAAGPRALDGGRRVARQQGQLLGSRIGLAGFLGQAPAAAPEPPHARVDPLEHRGDLVVRRRRQRLKDRRGRAGRPGEDAIERGGVKAPDLHTRGGSRAPLAAERHDHVVPAALAANPGVELGVNGTR
jgi:hypothetical protein